MRTQDGIINGDDQEVQSGIADIIECHHDIGEDLQPWQELMSQAAAAHLLIARDRGLTVSVDDEFLPDALDEYGIDDQIDLPRPDYLRDELLVPGQTE